MIVFRRISQITGIGMMLGFLAIGGLSLWLGSPSIEKAVDPTFRLLWSLLLVSGTLLACAGQATKYVGVMVLGLVLLIGGFTAWGLAIVTTGTAYTIAALVFTVVLGLVSWLADVLWRSTDAARQPACARVRGGHVDHRNVGSGGGRVDHGGDRAGGDGVGETQV